MDTIKHDDTATAADCVVTFGGTEATVPGAAILGFTRVEDGAEIHRVGAAVILAWRGALVPVVDLAAEAGRIREDFDGRILVVVRQPAPHGPKALLVDAVDEPRTTGEPPPVPAMLAPFVGAAMTGGDTASDAAAIDAEVYLGVVSGGNAYLLPLGDVVRIEPFPEGGLQRCGAGLAAVLSGSIVRAVPLPGCVPGGREGQALVVAGSDSRRVALVVDGLGEVVEDTGGPRLPWGRDGIVEALVVGGSAIAVLDVDALLGPGDHVRQAA